MLVILYYISTILFILYLYNKTKCGEYVRKLIKDSKFIRTLVTREEISRYVVRERF